MVVCFAGSGRFQSVSRTEAGSIVAVKKGLCVDVAVHRITMLGLLIR